MTTPAPVSRFFLLDAGGLDPAAADAVLDGCALAPADVALVDVRGPSAVTCLQGMFTNDLERPGDGAFLYGAVLNPKGMILTDLWALRDGAGGATLVVPADGKAALDAVLTKTLPPRLARAADRADTAVLRLVGPLALEAAGRAGLAVPEAGRSAAMDAEGAPALVARPRVPGPFELELHVETAQAATLQQRLAKAGAVPAQPPALELARVLAGWPRLGAEIDDRSLPQEVRYDELDGVSYTKGCYTGQETVARIHFRGHVNRLLTGVMWQELPDFSSPAVLQQGREVGWITSAAWLAPLEHYVGLAKVRREVDRARAVIAGGVPARLVDLPFGRDV
jgi:folate-binding protein YgfZ